MPSRTFADDITAVSKIDAVQTILEVVCRTTGMGFSAVARVTEDRWIACAVRDEIAFGLTPGGELEVKTTICDEIRESGQAVIIDHVAEDQAFCRHPTPQKYGFQSYISMPIVHTDGRFFGTLCAIDPRPAQLNTAAIVGMFKLFADLIAFHLDAVERIEQGESALRAERIDSDLREQFIAVLGHDLRNPIAAIDAGAAALQLLGPTDKTAPIIARIRRSVGRVVGLINDVTDFARGRLGSGISFTRVVDDQLAVTLEQVIAELRSSWPNRTIESAIRVTRPVSSDRLRIAQVLSNLLANALTHGDPSGPIQVEAFTERDELEITVTNVGEPIPPHTLDRLFQPFSRASSRHGQEGLGLGLYIASEIARAHDGTLEVVSTTERTRFTFRMKALHPTAG